MHQTKVFHAGSGRFAVMLSVQETNGQGIACTITGGELPHVGGIALASPGIRLDGSGATCDLWTSCVPGHKDAILAQKLAQKLCLATGQVVSVSAGLHVDAATSDDIDALCQACFRAADQYLQAAGRSGAAQT